MGGTRVVLLALIPLLFLSKLSYGQTVFDPMDYKAVGDGVADDAQALMDAFAAACQSPGPAVLSLAKPFTTGGMSFQGPCKAKVTVKVTATLKAIEDLKAWKGEGWFEFKSIDGLEISGGGILDGNGEKAWSGEACGAAGKPCDKRPTTLRLLSMTNTVVTGITIQNSKQFQMSLQDCTNTLVSGLKIIAPDSSPNTDGIHTSRSTNTWFEGLDIQTGDDCISLGQGASNFTVTKTTCGPGHGFSVGSLGKYDGETDLKGINFINCTLHSSDNGLRIKSWGGSPPSAASEITFQDIIMINVSNPIIIDQEYCPDGTCTSKAPSKVKLSNIVFKNIQGTSFDPVAVNMICSTDFPCQNVLLHDIDINYVGPDGNPTPATTKCTNIVDGKAAGKQNPPPCPVLAAAA